MEEFLRSTGLEKCHTAAELPTLALILDRLLDGSVEVEVINMPAVEAIFRRMYFEADCLKSQANITWALHGEYDVKALDSHEYAVPEAGEEVSRRLQKKALFAKHLGALEDVSPAKGAAAEQGWAAGPAARCRPRSRRRCAPAQGIEHLHAWVAAILAVGFYLSPGALLSPPSNRFSPSSSAGGGIAPRTLVLQPGDVPLGHAALPPANGRARAYRAPPPGRGIHGEGGAARPEPLHDRAARVVGRRLREVRGHSPRGLGVGVGRPHACHRSTMWPAGSWRPIAGADVSSARLVTRRC